MENYWTDRSTVCVIKILKRKMRVDQILCLSEPIIVERAFYSKFLFNIVILYDKSLKMKKERCTKSSSFWCNHYEMWLFLWRLCLRVVNRKSMFRSFKIFTEAIARKFVWQKFEKEKCDWTKFFVCSSRSLWQLTLFSEDTIKLDYNMDSFL